MPSGSTEFVGRARELSALMALWDDVRAGAGARVVAVSGEAGIGKTSLVRQAAERLAPDRVAWAVADPAETELTWGVLEQLGIGLHPGGAAGGPAAPSNGAGDAALVAVRVARHLASEPVLVVVDDAHWADAASSTALRLAVRRLARDPVLIVLVHQPPGPDVPGLDDGWRRLLDGPAGATIAVGGLDPTELALLAATTGHPGLAPVGVARLHAHTGGHPQHARHLLDELDPRVLAYGSGALPGPGAMAASVAARWRSCRPATRAFVAAAAVLGRRCDPAAALALAAVPTAGADVVAEALRSGLLEEVGGSAGRELAFPSSLVHGIAYHLVDPGERRRLHARAADLCHDAGGAAALWHRTVAAGGPDAALADDLQRRAAALAASGRVADATAHLRHALALTPAGPARAPRVVAAVEALLALGDGAAALSLAGELDAVAETAADWGGQAWAAYVRGYLARICGRSETSRRLLAEAAAAVSGGVSGVAGPADLAARIATQRSLGALIDMDYPEMLRQGELAVAGTRDPAVAEFARVALGLAQSAHGCPDDARDTLTGGLRDVGPAERAETARAETAPRAADGPGLEAAAALGIARLWCDDLDGASGLLRDVVDRATRGAPLRMAQAVGYLAETAYRKGSLGEATLLAELALGDAQENRRVWDLARSHSQLALPLAAQGRLDDAREQARQARGWAEELGQRSALGYTATAEVAIARAARDAGSLLASADAYEPVASIHEPGAHLVGPARAQALAWSGEVAAARSALAAWEAATLDEHGPALPGSGPGGRRASAWTLRALVAAEIELAAGATAAALTCIDSAATLAAATGLRLVAAEAELLRVEALLAAGRRPAAQRCASALEAEVAVLGAGALLTRLRGLAADHGLALGAGASALTELTPAERAVVALVCEGLSNREVAQRLVLSRKTVEFHLTQVFRRLDVTSRADLRDAVRGPAAGGVPRVVAAGSQGGSPVRSRRDAL